MRSWSVGRGRAGAPSPRSRFCRTCAGHRRWQLAGSAGCRQGRPWRSAGPTHKGPELSYIFACFFIFSADHDESSPEPADLAKQAGLAKSVNGVAPTSQEHAKQLLRCAGHRSDEACRVSLEVLRKTTWRGLEVDYTVRLAVRKVGLAKLPKIQRIPPSN